MSKALLQQHAAKTLKDREEQQQKIQVVQAEGQAAQHAQQAINAQNAQAVSQCAQQNNSLRGEIATLRAELHNHEAEHLQHDLPAYEDVEVNLSGVVEK